MDEYQYYAGGPERTCKRCKATIKETDGRYESTRVIARWSVLCTACCRGKRDFTRRIK